MTDVLLTMMLLLSNPITAVLLAAFSLMIVMSRAREARCIAHVDGQVKVKETEKGIQSVIHDKTSSQDEKLGMFV